MTKAARPDVFAQNTQHRSVSENVSVACEGFKLGFKNMSISHTHNTHDNTFEKHEAWEDKQGHACRQTLTVQCIQI